jgi:hypothetical protein
MKEQVEFAAALFRKLAEVNERDAANFAEQRAWFEGRISAYVTCAEHLEALLEGMSDEH